MQEHRSSRSADGPGALASVEYSIVRTPDAGLIRQAVRLHRRSLDQSFIASLGEPFLHALYEGLLRLDIAFLVIAREGDRLLGFILASIDTTRLLSVVMRSPQRFVWSVVRAVLRRPSTIARLVETLSYGRKSVGIPAELIVIAVQADVRSQGIGRWLLMALHGEFAARGIQKYKVTVHREMSDANRFYVQNGFQLASTFELYGMRWNLYTRDAGAGSAEPGVSVAGIPREDPR